MPGRPSLGAAGESAAAAWLEAHGYRVLARNVRSRAGEIDLIARQADLVIFVEVKSRTTAAFGHPAEAIMGQKQRRIARLASAYLQVHRLDRCAVRFDAMAVRLGPGGEVLEIEHIPDAFRVTA